MLIKITILEKRKLYKYYSSFSRGNVRHRTNSNWVTRYSYTENLKSFVMKQMVLDNLPMNNCQQCLFHFLFEIPIKLITVDFGYSGHDYSVHYNVVATSAGTNKFSYHFLFEYPAYNSHTCQI